MINKVEKVCRVFLPDCERPVNTDFIFLGEWFSICTYKFMRGHYGLQGNETPEGYFVDCFSKWLHFHIDVYPERGEYKIKSEIYKRAKRGMTAEELIEYAKKADEIQNAFVDAIVSKSNADKIRAMSDEELAEWLCDIAGWLPMYEGKMHPILDWLKEESEQREEDHV